MQAGSAPFSAEQRIGAIVRNGAKLLMVGFGSSLIGVGATQALTIARQALDPNYHSTNPPQNVLNVSAAYASYMAISSNLRYQVCRLLATHMSHLLVCLDDANAEHTHA